jgi:hypothetical protein
MQPFDCQPLRQHRVKDVISGGLFLGLVVPLEQIQLSLFFSEGY